MHWKLSLNEVYKICHKKKKKQMLNITIKYCNKLILIFHDYCKLLLKLETIDRKDVQLCTFIMSNRINVISICV